MLSKTLRPLPENVARLARMLRLRYRQRYLDLLSNEESRQIFIPARGWYRLCGAGSTHATFLEVEPRVAAALRRRGGAAVYPPTTTPWIRTSTLRIADELYLKPADRGALDRVYEISAQFPQTGH
jgi:lysyl-tRNA synthetase class 2